MFGLLLLFFEGVALLAGQFLDKKDFFDHRALVFERLNAADLKDFKAGNADPVSGWAYSGPQISRAKNCIGTEISYSVDAHGARTYAGYDSAAVQVLRE